LKCLFTVFISSQLQFEGTVHSFFVITTTDLSHYSQFLFNHSNSLKSKCFCLFSLYIIYSCFISYHKEIKINVIFIAMYFSAQLQAEITVQSFYLITTTVTIHYSQFLTTVISHSSQFLSHHNYSFKSLFTVFISSQVQFEVTLHIFFLITTTVINHYSQFLSHHNYSYNPLFTVFISSQLQL